MRHDRGGDVGNWEKFVGLKANKHIGKALIDRTENQVKIR